MITLKEIAEKCSVSIATVSNILNGKSNVSEATRLRILEVIRESDYKPNYMARGLRATKTRTVGILIDDLTEFSSPKVVDGIMEELEAKNYRGIIENLRFYSKYGIEWRKNEKYEKDVASAIDYFLSIRVDGIIYVSGHSRKINCIPDSIKELNFPFVIAYAFSEGDKYPGIIFNDSKAAECIGEHLIQRNHKKIALIMGKKNNIHTENRLKGFKKALENSNLPINENLLYYGDWTFDSGYTSCKNLLSSSEEFSAIFCFNDLMAAGAYKALEEAHKKVGKDIDVIGFDNREFAAFLSPPLTTMEIPLTEIGTKASQVVLNQIEGNSYESLYEIPCKFCQRESVGKLNNGINAIVQ